MRHCGYDDLAIFGGIDQKVGKPMDFLTPATVSRERTRVGKPFNKIKSRVDFGVKLIAQALPGALIMKRRLIEFGTCLT